MNTLSITIISQKILPLSLMVRLIRTSTNMQN